MDDQSRRGDRRKWISFTLRPSAPPNPLQSHIRRSPYSGIHIAMLGMALDQNGYSEWHELELWDRLETRAAMASSRSYLKNFDLGLQTSYDGNVVRFRVYQLVPHTLFSINALSGAEVPHGR